MWHRPPSRSVSLKRKKKNTWALNNTEKKKKHIHTTTIRYVYGIYSFIYYITLALNAVRRRRRTRLVWTRSPLFQRTRKNTVQWWLYSVKLHIHTFVVIILYIIINGEMIWWWELRRKRRNYIFLYTYHILFYVYAPEKTTNRYHHRNSEIRIILWILCS